jgi:hypothetical protein
MGGYFYIILGITAIAGIGFSVITRGIFYNTQDTDNELMAYAAAQSHKWRWLSDVHKYSASTRKVSMKECTVILLAIFQKLFRSKTTDWPYASMTGFAISISTILIYLIASNYFSPVIGLIVAVLYIISFWPWQISLHGGHVNMANLFFLLSIYSIQISSGALFPHTVLIAGGGAFFALCLFSSPSSHKYIIAIFAALFFSVYRNLFTYKDPSVIINEFPANYLLPLDVTIVVSFILVYVLALVIYKPVVEKMYYNKAPILLNKMISGRDRFPLTHYVKHANKKIKMLVRWSFWLVLSLLLLINFIPMPVLLVFAAGFIFVFFMLTLPNIKENVSEYFAFMLEPQKKTHFRTYVDYFAKRGITVKRNTRGAGWSWIPKMLWTFAPFHVVLFVATFLFGLYISISNKNMFEFFSLITLAFVALSPIIWAEITRAPQQSRLYSPGLITSLLLPAYVLSYNTWTNHTLIIITGIVIIILAWNLWRFTSDIFPSRMTVRSLMKIINQRGIKDIYTYDTILNSFLLDTLPGVGNSEYLPKRKIMPPFRIHYIRRLDEVKDGWIAIPGANFGTSTITGENIDDDYTRDPILNRLIETKQIEKIALLKLRTLFTSHIWVNEDDVTSYRALHLRDFKGDDFYSGHAWLIHSSKLKF